MSVAKFLIQGALAIESAPFCSVRYAHDALTNIVRTAHATLASMASCVVSDSYTLDATHLLGDPFVFETDSQAPVGAGQDQF